MKANLGWKAVTVYFPSAQVTALAGMCFLHGQFVPASQLTKEKDKKEQNTPDILK